MIVVSDTSPLITFAKIGYLQQVQALFGTVYVPPEVERELAAKGVAEGVPDILALTRGWLIVQAPTTLFSFPTLDPGEAAAISLAIELKVSSLLIDEKAGRKAAAAKGIPVIGTVGVLEEAAERGLLHLDEAFRLLKATNFRFPAKALDELLRDFHQRQAEQNTPDPDTELENE